MTDTSGRTHATRPTPDQHAAVMALLEAAGIGLPLWQLAKVAALVVKGTGGDPAGALLVLVGISGIEEIAND